MTNIYIDFSKTNPIFGNTFAGHIGEHNATNLIITPPKSMSEDNRIINYAVSFETESGERYKSDIYTKNTTVKTPLYSQLTIDSVLYIQLEGYGENKSVIAMSDVVFLRLGSSLSKGGSVVDGSVKPQENVIQFGWVPSNKNVLELLGEIPYGSNQKFLSYNERRLDEFEQFRRISFFKSIEYSFSDGSWNNYGGIPTRDTNEFVLNCYDIPSGYSVRGIIFRYNPDSSTGVYKEIHITKLYGVRFSFNTPNNSSAKVCTISTSGGMSFNEGIDFYGNDYKNMCDFLDWISEEKPISLIVEYEPRKLYP